MRATAAILLVLCACQHDAKPVAPTASPAPPPATRGALPKAVTDLTLPTSTSTSGEVSPLALRIYVGRKEVTTGDPPLTIALLPAEASHGFDESLKRSGPNDLFIKPIAAAIPKGSHAASLYFDRDTTYRVFTEVLFTLGQSEVTHYQLMTTGGLIGVDPPGHADFMKRTTEPHLGATVIVLPEGISVKARGGNIAPGCKDAGAGIAIPRKSEQQDFAALTECLARLRAAAPEFANEKDIVISAQPAIPYSQIIATIDAARSSFPTVAFGVSR